MAADASAAPQAAARRMKIVAGADDFGCVLKDALVAHLRSLPGVEVQDLGTGKYYSVGEEVGRLVSQAASSPDHPETRGVVACGTGVGVAIFANKFPRVYATTCTAVADAVNTRSINSCNVLAVGGIGTSAEQGIQILDAWLDTPFKAPCPASGDSPWPEEIKAFLDSSTTEMAQIPSVPASASVCTICCLRKGMEFQPVDIMPGAEMRILRQSPTSALVRFAAGSLEPAHHHTFGHDVVVMKGKKKVWNISKGENYDLEQGDYLFTPAGDVHRVKYFADTEFFIKWDGDWDIFLDEDLGAAAAAVDKELADGDGK